MHHSRTNTPSQSDEPLGRMGGTDKDIPILDLEGSGYGRRRGEVLRLQFDDHDDAVRYLIALAHEAQDLVEQIRVRQRDVARWA